MSKDVTFAEVVEYAWKTEPQGSLRVYWSEDTKLWFVHNFKNPMSAATAMGSSWRSAQEAANEFVESCKRVLDKKPELTFKERKAIRENLEAREALSEALAKWQAACVCRYCGNEGLFYGEPGLYCGCEHGQKLEAADGKK
jgi:hypothetical protein